MFFLFWLAHAGFIGLGSAVQTYTARYTNTTPQHMIPLKIGLVIASILSSILTLSVLVTLSPLMSRLIPDLAVRQLAIGYFDFRILGLVALSANIVFRAFFNGTQRPHVYTGVLLITHITNISLNYALIFGRWGAPEMGVSGAGLASTIALYVGTGLYSLIILAQYTHLIWQRVAWHSIGRQLIRLATPLSIQEISYAASFVVFTWIIGLIGPTQVAITNVIVTLIIFVFNAAYSIG